MPRRYYGDDNVYWDGGSSNPSTPSYYSGWHETNAALRVGLKENKPGNAFSQTTIQKNVAGAPKYGLARVYVSDPFVDSFTLSGTVKGQILANEQNAANDEMRAIVIRVWDPVTNTFRVPEVLVHLPAALLSEFPSVGTVNRKFPPEVPINSVVVRSGDRLVVEVGVAFFTASSGGGVTSLLRTGGPSGTGDLPENEVYTIPELASWIEFSMEFPGEGPGLIAGPPKEFLADKKSALRVGSFDYAFELQAPDGTSYDITERVALEGLSALTLALERNLHEFRAGDVSLTLDDGDGFFTQLFGNLQTTDRWGLTVHRKGIPYFTGSIPPIDSIHFDKKQATVEVSALDLSKLLEDTPAEVVARPDDIYVLSADVAASATTITLNTTQGLFSGDTLSLADEQNHQEFTIALIISATVVQVLEASDNAFTVVDTAVQLISKFYRYKTPEFLINGLLDAAGTILRGRSVVVPQPFAGTPIFSLVNMDGLPLTAVANSFLQKAAKHFARVASASFEQITPADAWTSVGTDRHWIDWSPYRTQADGEPATFATAPGSLDPDLIGVDLTPGALVVYRVAINSGDKRQVHLDQYTSADGITWAGPTTIATLGDLVIFAFEMKTAGGDYDSVRNRVYYQWTSNLGLQEFGYWDVAGATKVVLDSTDSRAIASNGNVRYSKEFDGVIVYNSTKKMIEVWRGSTVVLSYPGGFASTWAPKPTRYFNGAWYTAGYVSGIPSVLFTDDNFVTVQQVPLAIKPTTGSTAKHLTIVNGTVRVVVNATPDAGGTSVPRYFVAASSQDWTIAYADFSGESLINALDDFAILLNAVFFIDPDGIAYFVPRSVGSGETIKAIDDLVLERREEPIWLEVYDYVEFKLADGTVASAGTKTSISRNLTISTQIVNSLAVGEAVAQYLLDFYVLRRRMASLALEDDDTRYRLLDPIQLDGIEWLVYSIQRDLATYELSMELTEKVE